MSEVKMAGGGTSRGQMRPHSSKSPPFLLIGLFVVIAILGFNYWNASTKYAFSRKQVLQLSDRYQEAETKRRGLEKRILDLINDLDQRKAEVMKCQAKNTVEATNCENRIRREKDELLTQLTHLKLELDNREKEAKDCREQQVQCELDLETAKKHTEDVKSEIESECQGKVKQAVDQVDVASLCAKGKDTERVTILRKVLEHLGVSSLVVLQQNGILMDGIDLEQAKKDTKQSPLAIGQQQLQMQLGQAHQQLQGQGQQVVQGQQKQPYQQQQQPIVGEQQQQQPIIGGLGVGDRQQQQPIVVDQQQHQQQPIVGDRQQQQPIVVDQQQQQPIVGVQQQQHQQQPIVGEQQQQQQPIGDHQHQEEQEDAVYVDPHKEIDGANHADAGVGNATAGTVADGVMGKATEHDTKRNISSAMDVHDNATVPGETKDVLPDSNVIRPPGLVENTTTTAMGGVAYKEISPDETSRDGVPALNGTEGLKIPEGETSKPDILARDTEETKSDGDPGEAPQELRFGGRGQEEEIDAADGQNRQKSIDAVYRQVAAPRREEVIDAAGKGGQY